MLIRSQNKKTLLNMDRVTTVELGANGLKIVANTDDTVYALGDYSTKTLDSKVVSEKFLYFGDVKSIAEEVMSNE